MITIFDFDEHEVYEKIKDGSMTLVDFQIWVNFQKEKEFDRGWDESKEIYEIVY